MDLQLRDNIVGAVKQGLTVLNRPTPMRLSEWADQNFWLSSESSYIEGRWKTVNFQRGIMDTISNEEVREITFIKSARVGYSQMIRAAVGYFAEHKKRNQLVYLPADEPAKQFMRQQVETMIRDVPVVKLLAPWFEKKHQHSTERVKIFSNGKVVHVRGGSAAKNYRELSVDVVVYDELDGFPNDVEKEGSPLTLGDKRIEGSVFPKSIRGSTPKIAATSLVKASAESADCLFRFHIPCPHCGGEQHLKFGGKHTNFGLKWQKNDPSSVYYVCEHCAAPISYSEMQEAQETGRWKTDDGTWIDDDNYFRNAEGAVVDTPQAVAFHVWTAYSPFTHWSKIVKEWMNAQGDVTKLKTFVNTTLGEAWEDIGERANEAELLSRVDDYEIQPILPEGVALVVLGVDTQKDRLEAQLFGIGVNENVWVLDYLVVPGDPNSAVPWSSLDAIINRVYTRADGVMIRAARTAIDTGGLATAAVYEYVKNRSHLGVIGVKGVDGEGRPLIGRPTTSNLAKINLFPVGVMTAKDMIYGRLKVMNAGDHGFIHFRKAVCDERYFNGLTAEELKYKLIDGVSRRLYVKIPGRKNEELDTFVYGMAAYASLNVTPEQLMAEVPAPARKVRGNMLDQ